MAVTASASQMLRKTIYWLAFGFIRLSLWVWAPTFLIAYRQTLTRSSFMRVFMPGEPFMPTPTQGTGQLRLNFSHANQEQTERGLAVLAELVQAQVVGV